MTRVVHSPYCLEPLNEHTGSEPCLSVAVPEEPKEISLNNYKQGVQGNTVSDHWADYLARYGSCPKEQLKSTVEDRRDNRDPGEVGRAYLSRRNGTG